VFAGTVYDNTDCNESSCTTANPCPTFFVIASCCSDSELNGITTSIILGPSYSSGDSFVDQFGICWKIVATTTPRFPTLAFVTPVTDYGTDGCEDCFTYNPCPETLFYEVQNCCTEDIEVVELPPLYSPSTILGVWDSTDTNRECWKILSITNGPATYTFASIVAVYDRCITCIYQWLGGECPPTP
jgi:hypothetical protein